MQCAWYMRCVTRIGMLQALNGTIRCWELATPQQQMMEHDFIVQAGAGCRTSWPWAALLHPLRVSIMLSCGPQINAERWAIAGVQLSVFALEVVARCAPGPTCQCLRWHGVTIKWQLLSYHPHALLFMQALLSDSNSAGRS